MFLIKDIKFNIALASLLLFKALSGFSTPYEEHKLFNQDWPLFVDPDLGIPKSYSGAGLLTNYSQQMMDFTLLDFRQEFEDTRLDSHKSIPHSYAIFSGSFGLDYYHQKQYDGHIINDLQLYVTEVSMMATLGPLLTGLLVLDYDNSVPHNNSYPAIGVPIGGNSLYFDQAFFTIGNNNLGSWHGTIGQVYLPYGEYNSFMVNSPLTSSLFTSQAPAYMLAYSEQITPVDLISAELYLFHDFASTNPNTYGSIQNGALINYEHILPKGHFVVGASYVSDITNSDGIQYNSQNEQNPKSQYCELFAGFAVDCGRAEVLKHYVPGINFYADLNIWDFSFYVEYLTAIRKYAEENMTFNGVGASPSAMDLEISYAFNIFDKPTSISAGYTYTKEAIAMLIPAYEFAASASISLFRNTVTKLGFQYDIDYPEGTTATGQGLPVYDQFDVMDLGKTSYTVILMTTVSF